VFTAIACGSQEYFTSEELLVTVTIHE